MTIEELKNLKAGDVIRDIKLNKTCVITEAFSDDYFVSILYGGMSSFLYKFDNSIPEFVPFHSTESGNKSKLIMAVNDFTFYLNNTMNILRDGIVHDMFKGKATTLASWDRIDPIITSLTDLDLNSKNYEYDFIHERLIRAIEDWNNVMPDYQYNTPIPQKMTEDEERKTFITSQNKINQDQITYQDDWLKNHEKVS